MALKRFSGWRRLGNRTPSRPPQGMVGADDYRPAPPEPLEEDLLQQCLQLKRYGTVAGNRAHWVEHPDAGEAMSQAVTAIEERFGEVPDGFASLPQSVGEGLGSPEVDIDVEPYLLARHAVTNAEFQHFVDAGGYGKMELWPRDLWPQLAGFVDLTGQQAPCYWRDGRHDERLAEHPVVGVCYYEAAAYARWAGYRLPTEAEWQMAASWRLRSAAYLPRRFPWGDSLDTRRCNIWVTGLGATAPVDAYPEGATPNGARQLIGNVWEWTSSDYEVVDDDGSPVVGDMPMKSIRGGAFDTYFPAQAASTFRTGLAALVRAHNTGFRCAADLDLLRGD